MAGKGRSTKKRAQRCIPPICACLVFSFLLTPLMGQEEDFLFFRAEDHLNRGNYGNAIRAYEKLLAKNPQDEDGAAGLFRALLETGQYQKAREWMGKLDEGVKKEERIEYLPMNGK